MKTTEKNNCQALNKQAEPCKAAAGERGFCFFHADPERAVELGRMGGRNRHVVENPRPFPALDTPAGIRSAFVQVIEDLIARRIHSRTALCLMHLFNGLQRVHFASELQAEMLAVQTKVRELEALVGKGMLNAESLSLGKAAAGSAE